MKGPAGTTKDEFSRTANREVPSSVRVVVPRHYELEFERQGRRHVLNSYGPPVVSCPLQQRSALDVPLAKSWRDAGNADLLMEHGQALHVDCQRRHGATLYRLRNDDEMISIRPFGAKPASIDCCGYSFGHQRSGRNRSVRRSLIDGQIWILSLMFLGAFDV